MNFKDLKRITDFDLGVGDPIEHCVRVSTLGNENVSTSEVNLILWLLVEQEFGNVKKRKKTLSSSEEIGDEADSKRADTLVCDGLSKPQKLQARQYTEELLRCVGVNVPFELLNDSEKQNLFGQFCASSELLLTEKYTSILDLYQALRRRSKFREQFEILGTLGKGKYGTALKVKVKYPQQELSDSDVSSNSDSSSVFAIKRIHLTIDSLEDIKMILNESAILKTLKGHPNVVQFYDSWLAMDTKEAENRVNSTGSIFHQQDDDDSLVFYLQMELCGPSLYQWKTQFKSSYNFDERIGLNIARELADGVEWIHNHNFLHLDLNPKNIFWSDNSCETLKIGDFGLSIQGDVWNCRRGTSPYCAPEQQMTRKSDVYSIGVILFEMSQVFHTRTELMKRLERREFITGNAILDQILPNLLETDPSVRWSCSQLSSALKGTC